jgi:Domain of unknown function (DUF4307)
MTNDYLANRYGNSTAKARNQRILWTAVAATLVAAFFVWAILINFAAPSKITAEMQSFRVVSEIQTEITVSVQNPTKQDGVCAVQVLSNSYGVVGYKELAVSGTLGEELTLESSLNTTNLGVSATVDRCWFK